MSQSQSDVLALGEIMIELSVAGSDASIGVAGDTYNTAVYLKRSAPSVTVGYATRLGVDPMSDRICDAISAEGLNAQHVVRGDGLPGLYAISTDANGERSFLYWRSASAARNMLGNDGLVLNEIPPLRLVYLSAISLAILPPAHRQSLLDWLKAIRESGTRVAFDSNYRPALWSSKAEAQRIVETAWRTTDIALPSVDDEMDLFDDATEDAVVARLKSWGVSDGALKRGPEGPRPLDDSDELTFAPASSVVDTTAAGDSFNGGYLGARLSGADQPSALRAGHALASKVIGIRGAIIPQDAA